MRCTRSPACVCLFLLARLSSGLGDRCRYLALSVAENTNPMSTESSSPNCKELSFRQRLGRFTIRTLLIATFIGSVLLSTFVYRVESQKTAIKWIYDNDGSCWYDFEERYKDSLRPPKWASDCFGVDAFSNVNEICLDDCDVDSLASLSSLKKFSRLSLVNTPISDITPLSNNKILYDLNLEGTRVSNISPVLRIPNLLFLDLDKTPVRDVKCLADLPQLLAVVLPGEIDNEQIQYLKERLPNCQLSKNMDGSLTDL